MSTIVATPFARVVLAFVICLPVALVAQSPAKPGYPVAPRPLGEADEIALAVSAAPDEISSKSDVYVMRGTEFVKARTGTNGGACMVARDLHEGSLYPICFDREGAKSNLWREMMEASLRAKGNSEDDVVRAVDAAYASGKLRMASGPTIAYMMSPRQVIFSTPRADGVRVGAWSPHVMISTMPDFTAEGLGLLPTGSKVDVLMVGVDGRKHPELTIKVPAWSDGSPAVRAPKP